MEYDTKQQPNKKVKTKRRNSDNVDSSEYVFFHGRNYSNCLEYVKDYASLKNLTITYVEMKDEDVPKPLFEVVGFDWQVWRKNYGMILKDYWLNDLLDKRVMVWDNDTLPPPEGFTRLYRAIPAKDLPVSRKAKNLKPFVKKPISKDAVENAIH